MVTFGTNFGDGNDAIKFKVASERNTEGYAGFSSFFVHTLNLFSATSSFEFINIQLSLIST